MNVYRMLEILGEQNQFELLESENGFHTPQDIRLVYLMNDAVECFLTFRNARITGEYLPDYSGELGTRLDRARSARPWWCIRDTMSLQSFLKNWEWNMKFIIMVRLVNSG